MKRVVEFQEIRGVAAAKDWDLEIVFTLRPDVAQRLQRDPKRVYTARIPWKQAISNSFWEKKKWLNYYSTMIAPEPVREELMAKEYLKLVEE